MSRMKPMIRQNHRKNFDDLAQPKLQTAVVKTRNEYDRDILDPPKNQTEFLSTTKTNHRYGTPDQLKVERAVVLAKVNCIVISQINQKF